MRRLAFAVAVVCSTTGCGGCGVSGSFSERFGDEPFHEDDFPPHPPPHREFDADFGPIVAADPPPKPISGGTIAIDDERDLAAVGDPDRDVVHLVDLENASVTHTIALERGDDPGRAVFVPGGNLYVALRGGGAVVTIDPKNGALLERRRLCAAPRGLAHDFQASQILLVCVGGELYRFDPDGIEEPTVAFITDDLRDVVVENGRTWVSRFRSAEVFLLGPEDQIERTYTPFDLTGQGARATPSVAWRMIPSHLGGVLLLHQYATTAPLDIQQPEASYGGGGRGGLVVTGGITWFTVERAPQRTGVVPAGVDIAVVPVDDMIALANPSARQFTGGSLHAFGHEFSEDSAHGGFLDVLDGSDRQAISVAARETGEVVAFYREPASLTIGEEFIRLPGDSAQHTGHEMFHRHTFGGIACASCHPEGRDDGRVWTFTGLGERRTQSSRGLAGTAPFHWDGDMPTIQHLLDEVMTRRMGAGIVSAEQADHLERWLLGLPMLETRRPTDEAAIERGQRIYQAVGCGGCHAGPALTSNQSIDVGTGGAFQVPSLRGVRSRAPYMHDGCAQTLHERFDPVCGGGDQHGVTSTLDSEQISALVAYLETL